MATYTQGCSSVGGYSYAKNFTLYVVLSNRDGDSNTNKSWVDYNVYCQSSGSGSLSAKQKLYFEINGQTVRDSIVDINVKSPNAYIGIASGSIQVAHNIDGNKTIGFSASISASYGYGLSASKSDNFTLNKIPRHTTVWNGERGKTINSISVNWNTTDPIDWNQYSLNGGDWTDCRGGTGDNRSGYYVISGLYPNTTYKVRTRGRREDSGLWSISNEISIRTYEIAKITEASNFTDDGNPQIKYNNPSGNGITKLQACISLDHNADNVSYRDISKTGTSYTFNLTSAERKTLRSACKNKNSLTVYFYLKTILGSSTYYNSVQRTMSIVNANPTFNNFTFKDTDTNIVNNLTGNNQAIVKGYSNIEATISVANRAIAKKEASMVKYRLSVQNQSVEANYSSTQDVIMRLNDIKTGTFTVYAIDSRNNSTSKQLSTGNFIDYNPIVIKSIKLIRTNNVTSETTLNFNGYFWNGNFGKVTNTITECYYEYRVTGASNWTRGQTAITLTKSGNSFSYNGKINGDLGASGFDVNKSFDVRVIVSDRLSNNRGNPATFILGSGTPAMAIYKNKVAVGRKYDTSKGGDLQVGGEDIIKYINEKSVIDHNKLKIIYPVGSIYMSFSSTSPANLFGGTWTQLKGRFLLGVGTAEDNTSNFYGSLRRGSEDYWSGSGSRAGQFYEQLTINEMPSHRHSFRVVKDLSSESGGGLPKGANSSGNNQGWASAVGVNDNNNALGYTGGNASHNNMPPFITVYMWRRTG